MSLWQTIFNLRRRLREQDEDIRCLQSQLAVAQALDPKQLEWGQHFDRQIRRIQQTLADMITQIRCLAEDQRKMENKLMATIQEVKDALAEQNAAILAEIAEINAAMDELKLNPTHLDEIVASVKANTATVTGIVNEPLPEPTPEPVP